MSTRTSLTAAVIGCQLGVCLIASQNPSSQGAAQFRTSLDIVDVFVTVRGRDGAPVLDLDRGDFELRVDGKPREIVTFSRESAPVSVAMILDSSGSISGGDRERIRVAAQAFVGYLRDQDRMSIHTLYWDCQSFTGDRPALVNALQAFPLPLAGDPGSPIWNAVDRVAGALASERNRRAILLFSDGQDTGNLLAVNSPTFRPPVRPGLPNACRWAPGPRNLSVGDARLTVDREAVMMYAVAAEGDGGGPEKSVALRGLADITFGSGGALHRLGNLAEVRDAFARIGEELHLQYSLGFAQTEFDGKRHDIRVEAKRPNISVRARQSFVATKRGP